MVQSVELLLDPAADTAVRADWAALLAADMPSQGRIVAASNRPHITIAVAAGPLNAGAEDAIEATAARVADRLPMSLVLGGGLIVFPGRQAVLARSVVPSRDLLDLQAEFTVALAPLVDIPENMRPGRWTPHVTLARRVAGAALAGALGVVRPSSVDASVTAIRRWDGAARREWVIADAGRPEGSTRGSIP